MWVLLLLHSCQLMSVVLGYSEMLWKQYRYSLISSCGQWQMLKPEGFKRYRGTLCFQGICNLWGIPGDLHSLSFWKSMLNNLYLFGHELGRAWTLYCKLITTVMLVNTPIMSHN